MATIRIFIHSLNPSAYETNSYTNRYAASHAETCSEPLAETCSEPLAETCSELLAETCSELLAGVHEANNGAWSSAI